MNLAAEKLADSIDTLCGDLRTLRIDVSRLVDGDPQDPRYRALESRLEGLFRSADRAAREADQFARGFREATP